MTTIPFGTDITLSAAQAPAAASTPTVIGVIGLVGSGATASPGDLHQAHNKAEMLSLVGTDGELNQWAEEYFSRDTGLVLISPISPYTANDDAARNTAAQAALDEFETDIGNDGVKASIIDIHDYGTLVEAGNETDASPIVAHAELLAEKKRMMIYANYPAAQATTLAAFNTGFTAWLGNNRKARVLAIGGWGRTAGNAGGDASSTVLVSVRAALDASLGIAEPLHNKPISGMVGTYPRIPYSHNRNATLAGRTLQNVAGGSFIANYRGWRTVVGELATAQASDSKRYESILRCVDVAEDRYEDALGAHIGTQNGAIERAALLQELNSVTSALRTDGIIEDARFQIAAAQNPQTAKFAVTLTGEIDTNGVTVQINLYVEVK